MLGSTRAQVTTVEEDESRLAVRSVVLPYSVKLRVRSLLRIVGRGMAAASCTQRGLSSAFCCMCRPVLRSESGATSLRGGTYGGSFCRVGSCDTNGVAVFVVLLL